MAILRHLLSWLVQYSRPVWSYQFAHKESLHRGRQLPGISSITTPDGEVPGGGASLPLVWSLSIRARRSSSSALSLSSTARSQATGPDRAQSHGFDSDVEQARPSFPYSQGSTAGYHQRSQPDLSQTQPRRPQSSATGFYKPPSPLLITSPSFRAFHSLFLCLS